MLIQVNNNNDDVVTICVCVKKKALGFWQNWIQDDMKKTLYWTSFSHVQTDMNKFCTYVWYKNLTLESPLFIYYVFSYSHV